MHLEMLKFTSTTTQPENNLKSCFDFHTFGAKTKFLYVLCRTHFYNFCFCSACEKFIWAFCAALKKVYSFLRPQECSRQRSTVFGCSQFCSFKRIQTKIVKEIANGNKFISLAFDAPAWNWLRRKTFTQKSLRAAWMNCEDINGL